MDLFNPFGGKSNPEQLMYGRTAYFKYFELPIHLLFESIYPRLYSTTSTVRNLIDITNVPPTDLITLAAI